MSTHVSNAAPDEPVFILRAQDQLAAPLVHLWANLLTLAATTPEQDDKADQARAIADAMVKWGRTHGTKVPD